MDSMGVWASLSAVFDADGELDLAGFEECCGKLCAAGAQGLSLFSLEREWSQLSENEASMLLSITGKMCGDCGMGWMVWNRGGSTLTSIRWGKRIEASGANYMVVSAPSFGVSAEGLTAYYKAVAGAVSIPVLVAWAGESEMPVGSLAELCESVANVSGVVVADNCEGREMDALLSALPHDRVVLVGAPGESLLAGFHRGCSGGVVLGALSDLQGKLWQHLEQGEFSEAQELDGGLSGLFRLMGVNQDRMDYVNRWALERRGLGGKGFGREPQFVPDPVFDILLAAGGKVFEEE